jgi:hypothetical protein
MPHCVLRGVMGRFYSGGVTVKHFDDDWLWSIGTLAVMAILSLAVLAETVGSLLVN